MNKDEIKTYYTACNFIYKHYGEEAQKRQLIQELAELIVAITKNDLENIIEEMADVQVMLDQFTMANRRIYDKMEFIQMQKVKRQMERIEKEKSKK